MLEKLHRPIGAIDLSGIAGPFGSAPPPIDNSHLVDARTLFPEKRIEPRQSADFSSRPHILTLMTSPASSERDELVAKYSALCDTVDAFLTRAKGGKRAELEAKKAEVYSQCRQAEDELKSIHADIGRLTAQLNSIVVKLSDVRTRAAEAARPPYDTRFPTAEELTKFNEQRTAAEAEVAKIESESLTMKRELSLCENQRSIASQAFHDRIEELRAVDRELGAL